MCICINIPIICKVKAGTPHDVNRNSSTDLERSTKAAELKEGLQALGHKINVQDLNSGLRGITISKDGMQGGADPRHGGQTLGKFVLNSTLLIG